MNRKTFLSGIAIALVALGFTAHPLSAATFGNFTYTDDGTSITITGYPTTATGAVNIPATIIGKPVTSIKGSAFFFCTTITSVTIPEGVKYLGDAAFQYCYSLGSVTLPSTIIAININAFYNCRSMTSATFLGNAPPLMGANVFFLTSPSFIVYYMEGKTGFTTPTWLDYPTKVVKSDTVGISITGATTNGAIIHFTASTTSGLSVRLQSSVGKQSWSNLPDNNGAKMKESTTTLGNYDLNSTFYPPGDNIYFRAVASSPSKGDSFSPPLGPFSLTRAALSIQMKASSSTDPAHGAVTSTRDDLTYTFTVINSGSATARNLKVLVTLPSYRDNTTGITKPFLLSDIPLDSDNHRKISSGGVYHKPTDAYPHAQIIWDAADLPPGAQFSEAFTLHITSKVRTLSSIIIGGKDYETYGANFQPPYSATGESSGSPTISTYVRGPITFTAVAKTSSVAPGGLITYQFKLTNLTHSPVTHAVAVVSTPDFTRFATTYPTATGGSVFGVVGVDTLGFGMGWEQVFAAGLSASQILIDAGPLAAAGDAKDSVTFNVTFQAQWVDPAVAPGIGALDYYATFFNGDLFNNPYKPSEQINQYDLFLIKFYKSMGSTATAPGSTDFISFINLPSHEIALSHQDSGEVKVPLLGSLAEQPQLGLVKTISNKPTDTMNDGSGSISTVEPGDKLIFLIYALNNGKSVANDAFIQDGLPDHTTFIKGSAHFLDKTASTTASTLATVPDADGRHVRFEGLNLQPVDGVVLEYSVLVDSGAQAPAVGTLILPAVVINPDSGLPEGGVGASTIGSSSTPHTAVGYYSDGAIKVTGLVSFAEPKAHCPLAPSPGVSTDLVATANAMTAIYNLNRNELPLTNSADPTSIIPGVERYYIHYENVGKVPVAGVKLDFPLPANTAFYRAAFAALTKGDDIGSLINTPDGSSIVPPVGANKGFLATAGKTTFTFDNLAPGAKGDVMVEVIVKSDAVTKKSPLVGYDDSPIVIHDTPVPPATVAAHKSQSPMPSLKVNTTATAPASPALQLSTAAAISASAAPIPANVPKVGISRTAPNEVKTGDPFQIQITIFNNGDTIAPNPFVYWTQPLGTKIVKFEYGGGKKQNPNNGDPYTYTFELASNNSTVGAGSWSLTPGTAATVTITLQATGSAGSDIHYLDDARVRVNYMGQVFASSDVTHVTDTPLLGLSTQVTGAVLTQHNVNGADVNVIKLDELGTYIVAQGGGNVLSQGGGNVLSEGGGKMDNKGGGNRIVSGLSSAIIIGNTTGKILAGQDAGVVAQGGGNLIGNDGATISVTNLNGINLAAAGDGFISHNGSAIKPKGGGNVVSLDGGNFISQNGSAVVAQGGGNVVAQGGGNIVAQGGGNVAPHNTQNGANNVTPANPQILSSLPGSSASITSAFGNRIGGGGSNFRPNP